MPDAITASKYNIELRDKNGNLKGYLTPFVSKVNWEWNRIGGCGRCSLTINKAYRDIIFDARDDIQIRVQNEGYDPYTKLLVQFDGADASTDDYTAESGQTVSLEGTAQLDTAQKKFGSASLLLDGNSDYATVPDNANWHFGVNDFTVEFYVRFNDNTGTQTFIGQDEDGNNRWILKKDTTGYLQMVFADGGNNKANYATGVLTWANDTWYHLVFERKAASAYIFVDGVSKTLTETTAFGTNDVGDIASVLNIGYEGATYHNNYVNGWIDGVRISKGICRYTDDFVVPSSPYYYSTVTTPSKLVYRGYIANITPTLKVNQDIVLDVRGYFDLLKKIIVQDTGDTKTYTTSKVSEIVDDIADNFIVANSDITKGTIEDGDYTSDLDTIDFLGTVDDALKTLADIAGDIEYGVDEDLVFYWMQEHTTISRRFFVGNNVSSLERKVSYDNIVNKIYLVGGDVAGVKYKKTGEATDSQASYGLAEEIINNSSIATDNVAAQYITATLAERAVPQFSIRAQIKNINTRLEDTIPLGLVTFYDATYDRDDLGDLIGDIIGAESDITSNSIANPTVVTATAHGFQTGQIVVISGVVDSDPTINGTHTITVIGVDSFSVPVNVTTGGTGGVATSSPANGSNIVIGETGDGGSDVTVGGQYSAQVNRISYTLSDTPGKFNIDIELGDQILETSAKIKRLERELASVTQY